MMPLVSVCVCTYHRPQLLWQLLQSLARQAVAGIEFEVLVVDNDAEASSRKTIEKFSKEFPHMPLRYDVEPRQGISYARNRTVQMARGEFLAFIDDDEYAAPDWLWQMLETQSSSDADVVCGPVLPKLPDDAPIWATKGAFYERIRHRTGTPVKSGDSRTGNVLVRARQARARGDHPFDSKLAHSGGEDHEFFRWMEARGARFVWADDAVVTEVVPHTRLRLGYVLERKLRSSLTYWRMTYASLHWPIKVFYSFLGLVGGATFVIGGLVAIPFGLHRTVRLWARAMSGFGRVLALTRLELHGYRPK